MRACLAVLALACAGWLQIAQGMERAADAALASELAQRTEMANALEVDLLALIERAPEADRFELYRTYDRLRGAWAQVDLSQALLAACRHSAQAEEDAARTTLRDQARFALWDLDEARTQLARDAASATGSDHARISRAIGALLAQVRAVETRVLADQCAYLRCVDAP
ncbi:MAG TPA: hypothetical protein VMN56_02775 [Casimicrobiaceae bacterium]|nr:hypothetical protein [Casimicrobiaceae bacterium]